jgi:hypothetical protein
MSRHTTSFSPWWVLYSVKNSVNVGSALKVRLASAGFAPLANSPRILSASAYAFSTVMSAGKVPAFTQAISPPARFTT